MHNSHVATDSNMELINNFVSIIINKNSNL